MVRIMGDKKKSRLGTGYLADAAPIAALGAYTVGILYIGYAAIAHGTPIEILGTALLTGVVLTKLVDKLAG